MLIASVGGGMVDALLISSHCYEKTVRNGLKNMVSVVVCLLVCFMPFEYRFFIMWRDFFSVFSFVSFNGFVVDPMLSDFAFGICHRDTSFIVVW